MAKKIKKCSFFFSECIRVKYCDQHIHYDGNIGFRVPIAVKRRLFEMSFKRLPIPCMQIMLGLEAEQLLPHPTRFEEKLKNLSHVEIIELLQIINASLRKHQEVEPRGKKVPIKFGKYSDLEQFFAILSKKSEKSANFTTCVDLRDSCTPRGEREFAVFGIFWLFFL